MRLKLLNKPALIIGAVAPVAGIVYTVMNFSAETLPLIVLCGLVLGCQIWAYRHLGDQTGRIQPFAAQRSKLETTLQAIRNGADINHEDCAGSFPLLAAAEYGTVATLALLLKLGADVNKQNKYGQTALMHASINNTPLLLQAGAQLELRTIIPKGEEQTAMSYTLCQLIDTDNVAKARLLLEAGATVFSEEQSYAEEMAKKGAFEHLLPWLNKRIYANRGD